MHLLEVSGSEQVKSVSVFGKESEVKYKGEILPGEQPAIMDRQLLMQSSRSSPINGPTKITPKPNPTIS